MECPDRSGGVGVMAKHSIVGQCELEDDGEILELAKKESIILWCPWNPPPPHANLAVGPAKGLHQTTFPTPYDFDAKLYDFEVRTPLWNTHRGGSGILDGASLDSLTWKTTKST
jgi:hypothetical protein